MPDQTATPGWMRTVRLHAFVLHPPVKFPMERMEAGARAVFQTAGIGVRVVTRTELDLPDFADLEVGEAGQG